MDHCDSPEIRTRNLQFSLLLSVTRANSQCYHVNIVHLRFSHFWDTTYWVVVVWSTPLPYWNSCKSRHFESKILQPYNSFLLQTIKATTNRKFQLRYLPSALYTFMRNTILTIMHHCLFTYFWIFCMLIVIKLDSI